MNFMSISFDHDSLVDQFRRPPELARELLRRCLGREVPGRNAEMTSIDLSQVVPIEYRADALVVHRDENGKAVHAIIIEVQLRIEPRKEYTWPVYLTVARANLVCPVTLLVIAPELAVARWARRPIPLGGGFSFTPCVISLDDVPDDIDKSTAEELPELAMLAAVAHPTLELVETALRKVRSLDEEVAKVYFDLLALVTPPDVWSLLMEANKYQYEFQSAFAKKYIAVGREEGREEGRVALLRELLSAKFGSLPPDIEERLGGLDAEQHRSILDAVLKTSGLGEVLALLGGGTSR